LNVKATKIQLEEMISSGNWYSCTSDYNLNYSYLKKDNKLGFRLRILSIDKIDVDLIEDSYKLEIDDGQLWLMKIEVVNMNRESLPPDLVTRSVRMVDKKKFFFDVFVDRDRNYNHHLYRSDYAKITKLNRYVGGVVLTPKIKTNGALAFLLPNDDSAEYSITIKNGTINAV